VDDRIGCVQFERRPERAGGVHRGPLGALQEFAGRRPIDGAIGGRTMRERG